MNNVLERIQFGMTESSNAAKCFDRFAGSVDSISDNGLGFADALNVIIYGGGTIYHGSNALEAIGDVLSYLIEKIKAWMSTPTPVQIPAKSYFPTREVVYVSRHKAFGFNN